MLFLFRSVCQVLDSLSSPSLSVTSPSVAMAAEADEVDLSSMAVQCAVPVYIIQVGSDHTLVRGVALASNTLTPCSLTLLALKQAPPTS